MDVESITRRVFAKLGKEKQLLEYHDIIFKLIGVVVDFSNAEGDSLKLATGRDFNPYCIRFRSCASGIAACRKCDREFARSAELKHELLVYRCFAGLMEILLPLYDRQDTYIGSLTAGQFLLENEPAFTDAELTELAEKHSFVPEELIRLYRESKVLTRIQLEGLSDYLNAVGRLIVSIHNHLMFMETVNTPDKLSLMRRYVENSYMKTISIPVAAGRFHMSPGYFSHFFKQEVGISFMNYVNFYRIHKAGEMLQDTKLSVSEISFLVGFGSISQFNRVFRGVTGRSPRDWRAEHSE